MRGSPTGGREGRSRARVSTSPSAIRRSTRRSTQGTCCAPTQAPARELIRRPPRSSSCRPTRSPCPTSPGWPCETPGSGCARRACSRANRYSSATTPPPSGASRPTRRPRRARRHGAGLRVLVTPTPRMLPGRWGRGLVFRTVRADGPRPRGVGAVRIPRHVRDHPVDHPADPDEERASRSRSTPSRTAAGRLLRHLHRRRARPPPGVGHHARARHRPAGVPVQSRIAVERGARRAVRRRRGARARRVRAVVPPRRRVLGRGGPQVHRRDPHRRGARLRAAVAANPFGVDETHRRARHLGLLPDRSPST